MPTRKHVANSPADGDGSTNRPFEPFPRTALNGSIVDRFEYIAARYPDRLAVCDGQRSLTYAELDELAGRVSAAIMSATSGRAGPVAVLVPNDARYPTAILGVLGAGRALVAMDVRHAGERSRRIAELAGVSAVIIAGDEAQNKADVLGPDIPVLDIDAINAAPQRVPSGSIAPDDLAFILYTSGSTGKPKGAIHPHCNCLHATMVATNAQRISYEDRLAQIVSFAVAGGLRNCFLALLNGASLHIMSPQLLQSAGLAREVDARGITVLLAVPVIFRRMVEALGPNKRWQTVRHVHLAGDRITWDDFDAFQQSFAPSTSLGVSLGSSECFSHCLHWFVDEQVRSTSSSLPVGRAMPDLNIALVDDQGAPVDDGEVGELVLSGRYLAHGYYNDPELNARMFSTDPANPEIRIFRSGDLARRRSDGLYEFAGRKDHVVKLHGQRVDVGEIEAALRGCVGVREVAVVVRRNEDGGARALVAYCELLPDGDGLLPRHLLWMLRKKLPDYMVPADLFILKEIPRLSGTKVDRVLLAELDADRASRKPDEPHDPLLHDVISIFETVLGVSGATPEDNLPSLGGDSLQAVMIAAELETHFGLPIPAEVFEERHNIRELGSWIAAQRNSPEEAALAVD